MHEGPAVPMGWRASSSMRSGEEHVAALGDLARLDLDALGRDQRGQRFFGIFAPLSLACSIAFAIR
jgi:hypothetical protein